MHGCGVKVSVGIIVGSGLGVKVAVGGPVVMVGKGCLVARAAGALTVSPECCCPKPEPTRTIPATNMTVIIATNRTKESSLPLDLIDPSKRSVSP